MNRVFLLAYGLGSYVMFLSVFHGVGFVNRFVTPNSLDAAIDDSRSWSITPAALIDLALVAAFGMQHSVMARPAFNR